MRAVLWVLLLTGLNLFSQPQEMGNVPENARPGQCFSKVIVPATYRYEKEQVVVSPEDVQVTTLPAKYGYEEKQVMIKEASERYVTVPATYKWVTEEVLIQEPGERVIKIPAKYKKIAKKIMTSPATTEWKKGEQPKGYGSTEALCLVETPAKYKTVYERVLVEPAKSIRRSIPAQYKTVKRKVIDRASKVTTIPVPAEYKMVRVRKMIEPPSEQQRTIPAKYDTVVKKVKVTESQTKWAEILCKTNAKPHVITKVQVALKRAGYNPGSVDGVLGNSTLKAVSRFQDARNLPKGGITMETIKALNVQI